MAIVKPCWDDDALLYCEEQEVSGSFLSEADSEEEKDGIFLSLLPLLEHDVEEGDGELENLLSKEKESFDFVRPHETGEDLAMAVEWILRMNAHHGFTPLTAILAVNYLDRFLSTLSFQRDKPWMMQLAAVACLSLAAKVEETCAPLLLDLQVGGGEYVFEARTIQRMELLVLSALKWRMNPVTPLSFLHHIIRRLGFGSSLHFDVLRNCENLLLSILSDTRFRWCPPSVMAAGAVLHVLQGVAGVDYETRLLSGLKISKEDVEKCFRLLSDKLSNTCRAQKRKSHVSSDSFETAESCISSVSSSHNKPTFKKMRVTEQQMRLRVSVESIGSPR